MTDIVERLRENAHYDDEEHSESFDCYCQFRLADEAADEILRSRKINAKLWALLKEILSTEGPEHTPEWASEEAKEQGKEPIWCSWCGPKDGDWPCSTKILFDEVTEAMAKILMEEE